jgi:hypothetical protein
MNEVVNKKMLALICFFFYKVHEKCFLIIQQDSFILYAKKKYANTIIAYSEGTRNLHLVSCLISEENERIKILKAERERKFMYYITFNFASNAE